jgi:hypothetical protein
MKKFFVFILVVFCAVANLLAQQKPAAPGAKAAEILAKKHLTIDTLENQIDGISYAEVRVFLRHKIALWLWSAGTDDTDRAEQIAVHAINDLIEIKMRFPLIPLTL